MRISVLVGVVAACIVTTQARELQAEKSSSLDETEQQYQHHQQQQQASLSASTSDYASNSASSDSGLTDLFGSTSASESASASGSWDGVFESGSSSEASGVSASASDASDITSLSAPGDASSSVSSGSGEIYQGSLADSTSESQEASAATSTSASWDDSELESDAASEESAESGSASEASAASSSSTATSSTASSSGDASGSVASSGNFDQSSLFNSTSGSQDSSATTDSASAEASASSDGSGSSAGTNAPAATKSPEPSISVEDSVQLSESFGGPHGTEFTDEAIATSGQTVGSITIWAGKRVDGIALEITAPLGPDEYIMSMEAHWGKRKGRTRIFYLRFGTSVGNSLEGGSMTDSKSTVTAPEGFQLGGFFGRDGDEIDLLGAIWTSIVPITPAPGAPTPAPTPWVEKIIDHDAVVPFKQPEPVTIFEKAAIKFKPQLHITNGCHAYPAVNVGGQTSGGLKTKGAPSAGCKGSGWGSQVYGRSTWHNGIWAIMYSWYFPKDSPSTGLGHRHDWEHVIVWIDNPEIAEPKILAVDGNSVKVKYLSKWPINHALESTGEAGDYQDLIMWEQMTDAAR
ncbi:Necrosis inducing protein [Phytophthora cactorum]|nr:Necrosis inducing protein [Phytophthora cactorum]